jgi:hypothetical protein
MNERLPLVPSSTVANNNDRRNTAWEGYVSECYNFSEQVLNKGGLTLVAKEMFEWSSTLVVRIGKRFNKSSSERDGQMQSITHFA